MWPLLGEDAGGPQGCTPLSQDAGEDHTDASRVGASLPVHHLPFTLVFSCSSAACADFLYCVYLKLWLKGRLWVERGAIWGATKSSVALKGLPDFPQ